MEGKAAAIGGADFVMPFSALGLETYPVEKEKEKVIEAANKILENNYALVVVAENIAQFTDEIFSKTQQKATPCVVIVPFTSKSEGIATKSLGRLLKIATGINILENN